MLFRAVTLIKFWPAEKTHPFLCVNIYPHIILKLCMGRRLQQDLPLPSIQMNLNIYHPILHSYLQRVYHLSKGLSENKLHIVITNQSTDLISFRLLFFLLRLHNYLNHYTLGNCNLFASNTLHMTVSPCTSRN